MKILKYFGIVIAVLLAIFLSLGLLTPSFDYSAEVSINAPVQKCWDVLQDTSRMKKWTPGFKSLTLKSGNHLQAGARYEIVILQEELYVMQEKITAVKAPESISFELKNDVLTSVYDFKLVSRDSKTELTAHYHVTGSNLIWKSVLSLSKSYLKDAAQKQFELLKVEVETGELEFD